MKPLFFQTIKKFRIAFITYSAISVALMWMIVVMAPSILDEAEEFEKLVEAYPEGLMQSFGIEDLSAVFSGLEGFLSVEIYSIMWPIIALIMVIAFASKTIAGEIDQGTIEVLLAQPLSRAKVFWGKFFGGVALITGFTFLSVYSTVFFAWIHGVDFQWKSYHVLFVIALGFALALYGISIFVSTLTSSRGKAVTIVSGIALLMYALNILANLKESFEGVRYLSFFYYFDYQGALIDQTLSGLAMAVLFATLIAGAVGGLWVFKKRDIAV